MKASNSIESRVPPIGSTVLVLQTWPEYRVRTGRVVVGCNSCHRFGWFSVEHIDDKNRGVYHVDDIRMEDAHH